MADSRPLRLRAPAKINLMLRVLGTRPDGYHELRTVFQAIALHDTLTFVRRRGPFQIACTDPACPTDARNLVWRAAEQMWRAAGRRGAPADVVVRITKRIPIEGGLGGGSSDAAAALRAFAALWRVDLAPRELRAMAARLGADVPFFLEGGTCLGLDRGDVLFPMADAPRASVVLVLPGFSVSTTAAFGWWDAFAKSRGRVKAARLEPVAASDALNDLEAPVAAHHPQIARIVRRLSRAGARQAAMSGSGSAVFGLFDSREDAVRAARAAGQRIGRGPAPRVLVTSTLTRARYRRLAAPDLPRSQPVV